MQCRSPARRARAGRFAEVRGRGVSRLSVLRQDDLGEAAMTSQKAPPWRLVVIALVLATCARHPSVEDGVAGATSSAVGAATDLRLASVDQVRLAVARIAEACKATSQTPL